MIIGKTKNGCNSLYDKGLGCFLFSVTKILQTKEFEVLGQHKV